MSDFFRLTRPPSGWSMDKIEAFNDLFNAGLALFLLNGARTATGENSPGASIQRDQLRDHVLTLIERWRDTP